MQMESCTLTNHYKLIKTNLANGTEASGWSRSKVAYDQETDFEKKQIILSKIMSIEKLISDYKFQQTNLLKEAGIFVYKNFGVL